MSAPPLVTGDLGTVHRCPAVCRWLPRILGASVLAAGYISSRALDPEGVLFGSYAIRVGIILAGAALGLWLVRAGSEVHLSVALEEEGILFRARGAGRTLEYGQIRALNFQAPMAMGRRWIPAVVLEDRNGISWRIPALLDDCGRLLDAVIERSGESGLRSWAEARGLFPRIARARRLVPAGYLLAAVALGASLWFYFRP